MVISNQRGTLLLFVLSGIAMIAVIGMGLFYMISTSTLGQAGGSGTNRAYYLALAGKDYALANWGSSQLNGSDFILSNTERFQLNITNLQIASTGIVNKDTPFEARKTITSPSPSRAIKHFFESFEDLTKWATGAGAGELGSHRISDDKALEVTSAPIDAFGSGSGRWSFLQLNAAVAGVDFSTSWLDAGRCLSYDLQVKISNSRRYYMAGLNFKVAGSGNSREFYGISYLRARQEDMCPPNGCWSNDDNIPLELKPNKIWDLPETIPPRKYSQPVIVLWKRYWDSVTSQFKFTWLAYKLLTDADYVVASGYLKEWSNLQVRLIEAYPLNFTNGGPSRFLHNAIVIGSNSGARARISGTPIMTSLDESWSGNSATGTLTLSHWNGIQFQNGEDLTAAGTSAKAAGTFTSDDKKNFIRVYYGDEASHGANTTPTDNIRGSNPRNAAIHWPVDNVSDWSAANDYMTLVQWNGVQSTATMLGGVETKEANAIIQDSSLLTPDSGAIDRSEIALHATGNTAASTYFDDFAIQY